MVNVHYGSPKTSPLPLTFHYSCSVWTSLKNKTPAGTCSDSGLAVAKHSLPAAGTKPARLLIDYGGEEDSSGFTGFAHTRSSSLSKLKETASQCNGSKASF